MSSHGQTAKKNNFFRLFLFLQPAAKCNFVREPQGREDEASTARTHHLILLGRQSSEHTSFSWPGFSSGAALLLRPPRAFAIIIGRSNSTSWGQQVGTHCRWACRHKAWTRVLLRRRRLSPLRHLACHLSFPALLPSRCSTMAVHPRSLHRTVLCRVKLLRFSRPTSVPHTGDGAQVLCPCWRSTWWWAWWPSCSSPICDGAASASSTSNIMEVCSP